MQERARFYRQGDRDYVEISFVGQKDTVIRRVGPEHMARFKPEWDAYCDGRPLDRRKGTPLTDLLNEQRAEQFVVRNIHNLEELAALDDMQCQGLGHGTLTDRQHARQLIVRRKLDEQAKMQDRIKAATSKATPVSEMAPEAKAELAEIKQGLGEMKAAFADLAGSLREIVAMATRAPAQRGKRGGRRGRPPKVRPPGVSGPDSPPEGEPELHPSEREN